MKRTLLALGFLVAFLVVPATASAGVQLAGEQSLYREVRPSHHGTTMTFHASFLVKGEAERDVYFRVVPSPSNPAFNSGDPQEGWWTQVTLLREGVEVASGEGNGTRVTQLGKIPGNTTHTLRIDVRIPPGALSDPGILNLQYLVAARPVQSGAAGSGGTMDPSLSINAQVRVSETAEEVVVGAKDEGWSPLLTGVAIVGMGLVGIAGFVVYVRKQERR